MENLAGLARSYVSDQDFKDPIDFIESPTGPGVKLYPGVKFVIKLAYGMELNDQDRNIIVRDKFNDKEVYRFTEREWYDYLYKEKRVNLKEPPKKIYNHFIWVNGRRGLKTTTSALLDLYETYEDLKDFCPQKEHGLLEISEIRSTNVASSGEQSQIYYNAYVAGLNSSDIFKPLIDNITKTQVRFNTKNDLKRLESNKSWNPSYKASTSPCSGRTSRGPGCRMLTFDEFAFFLDQLKGKGDASDKSVYDALVPSTTTFGQKRRVKELSSPNTQSGMFYEHYKKSFDNPAFLMVRLRSFDTNPSLSPQTLKEEHDKDPDVYGSEYLAEFGAGRTSYLSETQLKKASSPFIIDRTKAYYFYYGLDLGLGNDGTGFAVSHVEDQKKVFLDHQHTIYAGKGRYENKHFLEFEDIINELKPMLSEFQPRRGIYDQWNGFGLEAYLRKIKLHQKFEMFAFNRAMNSEVAKLFKRLVLSDGEIVLHENLEDLVDELKTIDQIQLSKYLIKVEAPTGSHDDGTDSALRSVWLAYKWGIMEKEIPIRASTHFDARRQRRARTSIAYQMLKMKRMRRLG